MPTSSNNHDTQPPVLIIGGGIAGLALAQGLRNLGIPFRLFERDASTTARSQGYRVRIVDGAAALSRIVGPDVRALLEASRADDPGASPRPRLLDARTCADVPPDPGFAERMRRVEERRARANAGGNMSRQDGKGEAEEQQQQQQGQQPMVWKVDRGVLRSVLLTGLEEGESVCLFGRAFERYEVDASQNLVRAYFDDGTVETGRMIVGADGKGSRVRRQHVPEHRVLDTGGVLFYGKTPLTPERRQALQKRGLGDGVMMALRDTETLATPLVLLLEETSWTAERRGKLRDIIIRQGQQGPKQHEVDLPEDYMYWVLATQRSSLPEHMAGLSHSDSEAVAGAVQELTQSWDPDIRAVLGAQSAAAMLPVHSAEARMCAWRPSRLVTLVGDAVHGMPPTAGSGANTALVNVEALVRLLGKEKEKEKEKGEEGTGRETEVTDEAVGRYEEGLRDRARESIEMSFAAGKAAFGQKGLEECMAVVSECSE
ncbi:hypothetical protein F4778DRAFT_789246 [Xylariomycetidae sp. FL2044]|nr:hypothetical protein F4778DRAFT_789246 [Xylariomycetidae sp. FL2044]